MIETLDLIGKGLCIFLAAMLILLTGVAVAYLILNLGNKADAVPVVRCKDCKHGRRWYKHTGEMYVECKMDIDPIDRDSDFFCADGERRSE